MQRVGYIRSCACISNAKPTTYPGQATSGYCQDMCHTLATGYVWHISWQYPGVAGPGYVFQFCSEIQTNSVTSTHNLLSFSKWSKTPLWRTSSVFALRSLSGEEKASKVKHNQWANRHSFIERENGTPPLTCPQKNICARLAFWREARAQSINPLRTQHTWIRVKPRIRLLRWLGDFLHCGWAYTLSNGS